MKVVPELHHFTTAKYFKAMIELQCKTSKLFPFMQMRFLQQTS